MQMLLSHQFHFCVLIQCEFVVIVGVVELSVCRLEPALANVEHLKEVQAAEARNQSKQHTLHLSKQYKMHYLSHFKQFMKLVSHLVEGRSPDLTLQGRSYNIILFDHIS